MTDHSQAPETYRSHGPIIAVDARTFDYSDSTSRGIGHYALYHLLALGRLRPYWWFVLFNDTGAANPSIQRLLELPNFSLRSLDDPAKPVPDLFHIPDPMNLSMGFDSPMRLFPFQPATAVFYDLTPLRFYWNAWPEANRRIYRSRLNQFCHRPVQLLAISEFTKQDLLKYGEISAERITAIMAGLNQAASPPVEDPSLALEIRRKYSITRPFFLHVGALDPHKNFQTAVQAFGQLRRGSTQLVVVGKMESYLKQIADFCERTGQKDILFTGFLPREDLEILYREALALLFLSKYEGFGFPVLEAMAHGCPVIASNATSIPEVAGDAALLFEPTDVARIGRAMESLSRSLPKREELRRLGLSQAARFTWDETARRTLAVWEEMLGRTSNRTDPQKHIGGDLLKAVEPAVPIAQEVTAPSDVCACAS